MHKAGYAGANIQKVHQEGDSHEHSGQHPPQLTVFGEMEPDRSCTLMLPGLDCYQKGLGTLR